MIKEFEIPLYTGRVVVCVSEDAWTELKDAGLPVGGRKKKEAATCWAWVDECPTGVPAPSGSKARWIVALKPQADLNTVSHECYHLTNYIATWFGFTGPAGEDEAAAYLHGWLMERLWEIKNAYVAVEASSAEAGHENTDESGSHSGQEASNPSR